MTDRLIPLTPWQLHRKRWQGGCGSDQCPGEGRSGRVCLARGRVPCDVVFVGEAPGASEDTLGKPFVGPAGKVLDSIIGQALPTDLSYALTNLVGCLPRDRDGAKAGAPDHEQVRACRPRLEEFLALASPRLVVAVGSEARDYLVPGYKHSVRLPESVVKVVHVTHPAAILRMPTAQRGLEVRRAVVVLQNAVEELLT